MRGLSVYSGNNGPSQENNSTEVRVQIILAETDGTTPVEARVENVRNSLHKTKYNTINQRAFFLKYYVILAVFLHNF